MLRGHAVLLFHGLRGEAVELGDPAQGVEDGDVVLDELEGVAVAGADKRVHARVVAQGGQRGDDVICLVALLIQGGDSEGLQGLSDQLDLALELRRGGRTLRLILGELLLTEGRTREVEGGGDVGGLFLFHQPQEHPQESVHGVGVLPAGRREVGCREGIKGPEGQGMPVEQEQGFFRVTTGCHDRYPTELHPARCFVPTRALSYALTYCAPVAQLAEATDSKPVQCEFESHRGHDFRDAAAW